MTRRISVLGAGCLAGLCLGSGLVLAQQVSSPEASSPQASSPEDGGPVLTFGISSTLSATDNYNLRPSGGDSATMFDTRLSFGYLNRRANDVLFLDLNGVLRANEPPGGSSVLDDRNARLGYDREGVNNRLSFAADYNFSSVNAIDPFDDRFFVDDPLDPSDLARDRGDRERIGARISFESGLNDPVGFRLEGRYREQTFSDTTDPDLFDTEIFALTGTTRFTLSPVTEGRVILRYEDYSADDVPQTDRVTSSVSLGVTQALSQIDTLDVELGYQQIETDETIGGLRQSDTDTGFIGSVGLMRELARGTIGTSFDLRESVNGRTATWLVSRAMPLPRGGIEFSLGATSDVEDTVRPVGSLSFTHEMARSTLTTSIERQVITSSRSDELRTTRASLNYVYEINEISDLGFSANVAELDRAGGPAVNDTIRADLRATYSRDLTQDWRLSSGYEFRMRDEDNVGNATSNRLFLTIERNFVLRP